MKKIFIVPVLTLSLTGFFLTMGCSCASAKDDIICKTSATGYAKKKAEQKPDTVESVLKGLTEKTSRLKSYQAQVTSAFEQPMLETKTVREGTIYYVKDNSENKLRINFQTRKNDDLAPEKDQQEYIFDGIWLTRINYPTGYVEKLQLAPENAASDVMTLVGENFPLIGFSDVEKLQSDFDILLVTDANDDTYKNSACLKLTPKPQSSYSKQYSQVNFWVDKNISLPVRIQALTAEGDIYDLTFTKVKFNGPVKKDTFKIDYPAEFKVEIKPMDSQKS